MLVAFPSTVNRLVYRCYSSDSSNIYPISHILSMIPLLPLSQRHTQTLPVLVRPCSMILRATLEAGMDTLPAT